MKDFNSWACAVILLVMAVCLAYVVQRRLKQQASAELAQRLHASSKARRTLTVTSSSLA